MKSRIDQVIKRVQAEYLDTLLSPRDPLLARMEDFAAEHGLLPEGVEATRKFERTMTALFQVPKADSKKPKKGKRK